MSQRKKLTQTRFGIVRDVRSVPDPYGLGITFLIRRKGHPAYKDFAAQLTADNKLSQAFQLELSREQVRASMTGKKINKEAAVDRAIDRIGSDLGSTQDFIAKNIERVAHLLDGWQGNLYDDGTEVEFSLAEAIEMLSLENPIDPALPYATRTIEPDEEGGEPKTVHRKLGEALMAFIEEQADDEEAYLEGLAKNSAASSAGAPASSAD